MIKPTKKGWAVFSDDGKKRLSKDGLSKKEAQERLRQIEYFKHKGRKKK